ncbi:hypothetical protein QFC21_000821 [Naganishia friedmannii]|uniref:Uncharacterized protein n=1 Tax=Naganishia friedmannii TaxID=89922 RepID=A0ACC2W8J2_9TREE|nr:hypothetical protein QFC21_000821 [Naganishia friedmannii]
MNGAYKTTFIVAPLALLEQWKLEIEHKTYGQLRVYIFHGPNKNITKKQLKKYDVVLTTYGTLVQQFPPPEKKEKTRKPNDFIDESAEDDDHEFTSNKVKHGPLALVYWYRVVLDEAAQIRNKRTRAAKACFELDALNRWVLSGTLIAPHQRNFGAGVEGGGNAFGGGGGAALQVGTIKQEA